MQSIEVKFASFLHNIQIQNLPATLTPSNPTFLMISIVGTINLHDSIWRDNRAGGFGAVLYIEAGVGKLSNLHMTNSNWDGKADLHSASNFLYFECT
jgi:hypothetical protein